MRPLLFLISSISVSLNVSLWISYATARCTWYHLLPVAKNQPYGLADVIELGLFVGILGTGALTSLMLLLLLFFGAKERRNSTIARFAVLLLISAVGYYYREWSLGHCGR